MRVIITGTDTDVGKTVLSAALSAKLHAHYWKPVQSGLDAPTDSQTIATLAGPHVTILPEAYRLAAPLSPNIAARRDGVLIEREKLLLPAVEGPLVVEGAGGVLVPYSDTLLAADLFAIWSLPVILVARTSLGTINHTLLSIEALRARKVPLLGVFFMGPENRETEACIVAHGATRHLGRLPRLDPLTPDSLAEAFAATTLAGMAQ